LLGFTYVVGSPIHIYFALVKPMGYRDMSEWAPPVSELAREFWYVWFLPNARIFALVIAGFEIAVGILIVRGGSATRWGLVGALGFHLALAGIFGMWPYTVPMIVVIAWALSYDFDPLLTTARLKPNLHHMARRWVG
jgi:hypothetical protein